MALPERHARGWVLGYPGGFRDSVGVLRGVTDPDEEHADAEVEELKVRPPHDHWHNDRGESNDVHQPAELKYPGTVFPITKLDGTIGGKELLRQRPQSAKGLIRTTR